MERAHLFLGSEWEGGRVGRSQNIQICAQRIVDWKTKGPLHDPVTWYKITHAGAWSEKFHYDQGKVRKRQGILISLSVATM